MHLWYVETSSGDARFAELYNPVPHFGQTEEFAALLIHTGALFYPRLFLQLVIVAQTSLAQQIIDHLAALAAEITSLVLAVVARAGVPTMEAGDLGQLSGLHGTKCGNREWVRADGRQGPMERYIGTFSLFKDIVTPPGVEPGSRV